MSAKKEKKSKRISDASIYREASSDDEFAKENFMFSSASEGEEEPKSSKKAGGGRRKRNEENDGDSDASCGDEEEVKYRIQHILSRRSMPQSAWRELCDSMETREVTRGSVWQQPDEEYLDPSPEPVEKFLIKWAHASFLHVSWETERDLITMVGAAVKSQIKKFRLREHEGTELFDDLSKGEAFPPSYLIIDRILDVDDPDINMDTVKWDRATIPVDALPAAGAPDADCEPMETEADEQEQEQEQEDCQQMAVDTIDLTNDADGWEGEDAEFADSEAEEPAPRAVKLTHTKVIKAAKTGKRKGKGKKERKAKKAKKTVRLSRVVDNSTNDLFLHGQNTWVTVKWEGLTYSDVSFESLRDITNAGIEYEKALRMFYARERKDASDAASQERKLDPEQLQLVVANQAPIPEFKGGNLRDYQWEGVRWMMFNFSQNRNCILADEMGLGKTIQSAGILQMLKQYSATSAGPFLVVAPLTLIVNWQREITTWTDLDSILYYGSQEDRELIRAYEFNFLDNLNCNGRKKKNTKKGYKVEVVITTPETCVALDATGAGRNRRELSQIHWDLIIIDEAHKLKNYESKLGVTLREEYTYRNCLLLTGTPLQNNTDELWTLLNFVDRTTFEDRDAFYEQFGDLKTSKQLLDLHTHIRPYLLRREKDIVEKSVPPKEEIIVEVELTVPQKQYYRAIYEQKTQFLYKSGAKDGPSLSNLAMELRKCCNHPFLIKGAPAELAKHFATESPQEVLVKASGKMTLLDKLLPKLFKDKHRVLIFSQFRIMLDIIEDYLHNACYSYERIDGSVTGRKRQAAIDRFTANPDVFVMLLSTRAGGVGINLTAADTVIIFDSDWNPQNDVQAQARAHRIGQTRAVTVYRLLTKKSYEMVMFKAASLKLGLDYAIMHNLKHSSAMAVAEEGAKEKGKKKRGKEASNKEPSVLEGISTTRAENFSALSKKELENLLKHGAYDIFLEEKEGTSDAIANTFVEESIETILARSSMFLHTDGNMEAKLSEPALNFAKASFVSAAKVDNDVAIDDPDFWTKVVGLGVDNGAEGQALVKRRRAVESYRDPGDTLKSIYGDRASAYVTDSEDSGDEKSPKRRKATDTDVPAEYTLENMNIIHNALLTCGYGNWERIRQVSRLRWPLEDVIKASEIAVIFYALMAAVVIPVIKATPTAAIAGVVTDAPSAEVGAEAVQAMDVEEAAAPAQAAEQAVPAAAPALASVDLYKKIDYKIFEGSVRKFKLLKLVLSCLTQREQDTGLVEPYQGIFEKIRSTALAVLADGLGSAKALTAAYDQLLDISEEMDAFLVPMQAMIAKMEDLPCMAELCKAITEDADASKINKKLNAYKMKLVQLEDMYEAYLISDMFTPPAPQADAEQAMDVDASTVMDKLVCYITTETMLLTNKDIVANKDWTAAADIALLQAVGRIGWPEGKRRLALILAYLIKALPDVFKVIPVEPVAAPVAAEPVEGALPAAVVLEVPVVVQHTNSELLTSKFLIPRLRTLARFFRYASEDLMAVIKAQEAVKTAALRNTKKNVNAVLKAVQKMGYPRSNYAALADQVDGSMLLTWEQLAKECGMDTEDDLKEIFDALYQVVYHSDISEEKAAAQAALLEGIPEKTIQSAFEKCDVINHVRLLLAVFSKEDLQARIQQNCKTMGLDIPIFKRDMTMPFWWTLDMDYELMRLLLVHGHGQWKKLIADAALAGPAPDTMQVPPKVNGIDWALVLTPKSLEKRITSLLRGLPAVQTLPVPPPTSPASVRKAYSVPAGSMAKASNSKVAGSGLGNWFATKSGDTAPTVTIAVAAAAPTPTPSATVVVAVEAAKPAVEMMVIDLAEEDEPVPATPVPVPAVPAAAPSVAPVVMEPVPVAPSTPAVAPAEVKEVEKEVTKEMTPMTPSAAAVPAPKQQAAHLITPCQPPAEDRELEVLSDSIRATPAQASPVAVTNMVTPTAAASSAVKGKPPMPSASKSKSKAAKAKEAEPVAKKNILSFFQKAAAPAAAAPVV